MTGEPRREGIRKKERQQRPTTWQHGWRHTQKGQQKEQKRRVTPPHSDPLPCQTPSKARKRKSALNRVKKRREKKKKRKEKEKKRNRTEKKEAKKSTTAESVCESHVSIAVKQCSHSSAATVHAYRKKKKRGHVNITNMSASISSGFSVSNFHHKCEVETERTCLLSQTT